MLLDTTLENITELGPHDVICGRGTKSNKNKGNILFRNLVKQHKRRYVDASKIDKPKVAREVMKIWRNQSPAGRFLMKKESDDQNKDQEVWFDIGDQKAREKASQCLRERTPDIIPYLQKNVEKNKIRKKVSPTVKTPMPNLDDTMDEKNDISMTVPATKYSLKSSVKSSIQLDRLKNAMLNSMRSMNCSLLPGDTSQASAFPYSTSLLINNIVSPSEYMTPPIVNNTISCSDHYATTPIASNIVSLPGSPIPFEGAPIVDNNIGNQSEDPIVKSIEILRKLETSLRWLQEQNNNISPGFNDQSIST